MRGQQPFRQASLLLALSLALTAPGAAEQDNAPQVHRVRIEAFTFHPATVTVKPGDVIEWVNHDFVPHTATATDGTWDSGELGQGARYRLNVSASTIGNYYCRFHPTMVASFAVTIRH